MMPTGRIIRIWISSDSNGKEKDPETGFLYYGARYHWPEVWSGWLSPDPMMDVYPGISPYNYCNWNPVIFVDPDGREIWLVDKDGYRQPYYIGMKTEGFNTYMSETINALNKLSTTETMGDKIKEITYSPTVSVDIIENFGETAAIVKYYEGITDQIPPKQELLFDPNLGIQNIETKEVMSPAAVLGHEVGHIINALTAPADFFRRKNTKRDDVWDNDEEYYNIHTWEYGVISEWNEMRRDGHNSLDKIGNEKYRIVTTTGSTSKSVTE